MLAIIGPFSSGEVSVAVNDAERAHIVMMPGAASLPGLSKGKKYLFRLAQDEGVQFDRMLQTLKKHDIPATNAGIVYISDEAVDADAGTRVYPQLMDKYGIKHDDVVSITYKTFDPSPQVAQAAAGQSRRDRAGGTDRSRRTSIVHELRRQGFAGRDHRLATVRRSRHRTTVRQGRRRRAADDRLLGKGLARRPRRSIRSSSRPTRRRASRSRAPSIPMRRATTSCMCWRQAMTKANVTGDPDKLDAEREAIQQAMVGITYSGVLGHDICFDGQDARLPGYAIEIRDSKWNLFETFAAAACGGP